MRFLAVALILTILTVPAVATMARADNSSNGAAGSHSFGGLNCPQRVPCPELLTTMPSTSDLAANASSCLTQYFGIVNKSGSGFFDESAGLDSNNCLTTKSSYARDTGNTRTVPNCCITKAMDNSCLFRCDLRDTH